MCHRTNAEGNFPPPGQVRLPEGSRLSLQTSEEDPNSDASALTPAPRPRQVPVAHKGGCTRLVTLCRDHATGNTSSRDRQAPVLC